MTRTSAETTWKILGSAAILAWIMPASRPACRPRHERQSEPCCFTHQCHAPRNGIAAHSAKKSINRDKTLISFEALRIRKSVQRWAEKLNRTPPFTIHAACASVSGAKPDKSAQGAMRSAMTTATGHWRRVPKHAMPFRKTGLMRITGRTGQISAMSPMKDADSQGAIRCWQAAMHTNASIRKLRPGTP